LHWAIPSGANAALQRFSIFQGHEHSEPSSTIAVFLARSLCWETVRLRRAIMDSSAPTVDVSNSTSLDALRAEILARCGVEAPVASQGVDGNPLGGKASGGGAHCDASAPDEPPLLDPAPSETAITGRKTLADQREVFERLKQQFKEAQNSQDPNDMDLQRGGGVDEQERACRSLEDEVRRLRRENATLQTALITAQEEAIERTSEGDDLLKKVSALNAELEDARLQHRGDASGVRQQLQETMGLLEQSTQDMARMQERASAAEQASKEYVSKAERLEDEVQSLREQTSELEISRSALEEELAAARAQQADSQGHVTSLMGEVAALREQSHHNYEEWRLQQERLESDLRSRENEVSNLKRVLDDVMSAHAPLEEVQRWRSRAESFEQQYNQAMKYNREMTSAVGHLTQAAGERGADLNELQQRNAALSQEQERRQQELKMAELEKQDLQKERDTLESSCNYFQAKYKSTQNDLRVAQRELASAQDVVKRLQAQLGERQREAEALRSQGSKLSQQIARMQETWQKSSQRFDAINDGLGTLFSLHSEQARLYEKVVGEIHDKEVLQGLQERRAKEKTLRSQLRSLLAEMMSNGGKASESNLSDPVQNAVAEQQRQRQQQQEQQHRQHQHQHQQQQQQQQHRQATHLDIQRQPTQPVQLAQQRQVHFQPQPRSFAS